jgi:hypothetical protein
MVKKVSEKIEDKLIDKLINSMEKSIKKEELNEAERMAYKCLGDYARIKSAENQTEVLKVMQDKLKLKER